MKLSIRLTIVGLTFFLCAFLAASPAHAQTQDEPKAPKPAKLSNIQKQFLEILDLKVIDPPPAVPGSVVKVTLKGVFKKKNYHTYPITKVIKGQDQTDELNF